MRPILLAAAAFVALLAGCAAPSVQMMPSGPKQAARRSDCRVAFFRVKAPERPFDEVAVLQYEGRHIGLQKLQELMRLQACAAGGDALVVTREYAALSGRATMVATAIRYRDLTAMERAALDKPRDMTEAPAGYVVVVVKQAATVHPDPVMKKPATATLSEGTILWQVEPAKQPALPFWTPNPGEYGTVVQLPDGTTGYMSPGVIAPYQAPASKPQDAGEKPAQSDGAI